MESHLISYLPSGEHLVELRRSLGLSRELPILELEGTGASIRRLFNPFNLRAAAYLGGTAVISDLPLTGKSCLAFNLAASWLETAKAKARWAPTVLVARLGLDSGSGGLLRELLCPDHAADGRGPASRLVIVDDLQLLTARADAEELLSQVMQPVDGVHKLLLHTEGVLGVRSLGLAELRELAATHHACRQLFTHVDVQPERVAAPLHRAWHDRLALAEAPNGLAADEQFGGSLADVRAHRRDGSVAYLIGAAAPGAPGRPRLSATKVAGPLRERRPEAALMTVLRAGARALALDDSVGLPESVVASVYMQYTGTALEAFNSTRHALCATGLVAVRDKRLFVDPIWFGLLGDDPEGLEPIEQWFVEAQTTSAGDEAEVLAPVQSRALTLVGDGPPLETAAEPTDAAPGTDTWAASVVACARADAGPSREAVADTLKRLTREVWVDVPEYEQPGHIWTESIRTARKLAVADLSVPVLHTWVLELSNQAVSASSAFMDSAAGNTLWAANVLVEAQVEWPALCRLWSVFEHSATTPLRLLEIPVLAWFWLAFDNEQPGVAPPPWTGEVLSSMRTAIDAHGLTPEILEALAWYCVCLDYLREARPEDGTLRGALADHRDRVGQLIVAQPAELLVAETLDRAGPLIERVLSRTALADNQPAGAPADNWTVPTLEAYAAGAALLSTAGRGSAAELVRENAAALSAYFTVPFPATPSEEPGRANGRAMGKRSRRIVHAAPGRTAQLLSTARVARWRHDLLTAIEALHAALEDGPSVPAYLEMASIYGQLERTSAQIRILQEALAASGPSFDIAFELARAFRTQGNIADSVRFFEMAYRFGGDNQRERVAMLRQFGAQLDRAHRSREALPILLEALGLDLNRRALVDALALARKLADAGELFYAGNAVEYEAFARALLRSLRGRLREPGQAQQLVPGYLFAGFDEHAWELLASMLPQASQPKEHVWEAFHEARRPEEAAFYAGLIELEREDYEAALAQFRRAEELWPDDAEVHLLIARCHAALAHLGRPTALGELSSVTSQEAAEGLRHAQMALFLGAPPADVQVLLGDTTDLLASAAGANQADAALRHWELAWYVQPKIDLLIRLARARVDTLLDGPEGRLAADGDSTPLIEALETRVSTWLRRHQVGVGGDDEVRLLVCRATQVLRLWEFIRRVGGRDQGRAHVDLLTAAGSLLESAVALDADSHDALWQLGLEHWYRQDLLTDASDRPARRDELEAAVRCWQTAQDLLANVSLRRNQRTAREELEILTGHARKMQKVLARQS